MKTAAQLTKQEIEFYRESARRRQAEQSVELQHRKERAWSLARQAAAVLREKFHATRVVVFGSMANNLMFTLWSDVDLAAWGLRSEDTFRAIGELYDLDANIPVNLVDINTAPGFLLETIENEGVDV